MSTLCDVDTGTDMVTFTTDRGANTIVALKTEQYSERVRCSLVARLRNAFDPEKGCPDQVCTLLTAVKNIVRYFKKSGYQILLPNAFQQSCDSRWNSVYYMLQSLHVQYDKAGLHLMQEIDFFPAVFGIYFFDQSSITNYNICVFIFH